MKKKNIFDGLYNRYLKKKNITEIYGSLAYFFQYVDIYNKNVKNDQYLKEAKMLEDIFQNSELLKVLGDYWHSILEKITKETDLIKIIEYQIILLSLSKYIMEQEWNREKKSNQKYNAKQETYLKK